MLLDSNKVVMELEKVGIIITDIYDLVNSNITYSAAIPTLVSFMKEEFTDIKVKEGIVRSLAVKEAAGKANSILITEYNNSPKELASYRWAIGNTIYMIITDKDVESILPIVLNKENGRSRQMFVAALGKVKSQKIEDILIQLLDDDEVAPHALEALGRLKSINAIEKIKFLANHSNSLIKREAQKALKKIEKIIINKGD